MISSFNKILPSVNGFVALVWLGVISVMPFIRPVDLPSSPAQAAIDRLSLARAEVSLVAVEKEGIEGNAPCEGSTSLSDIRQITRAAQEISPLEEHRFTPVYVHLIYTLIASSDL